MLRITSEETGTGTKLRLEGKLKGAWVAELEALYLTRKRAGIKTPLMLEVDELTEADQAGKLLLALIQREGGILVHTGPEPIHLLWEGIQIPDPAGAH